MYWYLRAGRAGPIVLCLAITMVVRPAVSETKAADGGRLDDEGRRTIVEAVAARLVDEYVFPDVADTMVAYIKRRAEAGAYDQEKELEGFLAVLAEDLQSIRRDQHLGLRVMSGGPAPPTGDGEMSDEQKEFWKRYCEFENYGIHDVSRLEGNVGYIDLRFWPPAEFAAESTIAAMTLLRDVDALVIDVRRHLGGRFHPAQLVLSYLFEDPIHFMNTIDRRKGGASERWTFGIVPGARLSDIPIFVLTSWETASGGELLPFVLKNSGRATIVGERTRGAGSRTHRVALEDLGIDMFIPHAVDVDPATGTGWDGVGVSPDVETTAADALARAHVLALQHLLENRTDAMPHHIAERRWALTGKRAEFERRTLSGEELEEYAGNFGERKAWVEDGVLHYQVEGKDVQRLIPMVEDWFEFASTKLYYVRLRFERDATGAVEQVVVCYDNGREDASVRTGPASTED